MRWNLPSEWLLKLHEETWLHIRPSVAGIRKFLGEDLDNEPSPGDRAEGEAPDCLEISPEEALPAEKPKSEQPQVARGELRIDGSCLSAEDVELIKTIIINYYKYSPEVKALCSGMGVSQQYYEFFQKIIFKKFRHYLPGDLDFHDLVNEGWLKLLTKCHLYHYKARFSVWAYSVFINAAHEFIRNEKRYRFRFSHSLDEEIDDRGLKYKDKLVADSNIEKEIEESEQKNINRKVIEGAVHRTRNAVRDAKVMELYQENKKYKEIAEELNLNINTVSIIIHRIKKHLTKGRGPGADEKSAAGDEKRGTVASREKMPQS